MKSLHVETATAADAAAVIDAVTLAFSGDPMARWSWADPTLYLATFPRFARAFGGVAFERGTAHRVGYIGAALWRAPGVYPDGEKMGVLMAETIPPALQKDGEKLMEQMNRFHPQEPHWYLPLIGIDPAHQGKGLGGALLRHQLAICDRDGAPAYLESSNPRNIGLYERHGFEALGYIQAGSSPTMVPMLRKPQRRT
ncbi:N-acetyltransferase [Reyranella sp.]|uniref:GNAT family N-acetyltransferase n=1 Tax=Reyranella sp. TaxID=1929291 RepID=UPI00273008BA|nr:GNAT family N-acetyltransferase [Reyranella sp.]MDP2377749.1 GNAT family N-acetyltransferase [Reyranella sp.]